MMSAKLQPVNYSSFRHVLSQNAGPKVRNKGKTTYVYDQHNRIVAMLKTASMDAFGRIQPAQYFARTG